MEKFFLFLFQRRAFILFLVLEGVCAWMVVRSNSYNGATYFNSSNYFFANINAFSSSLGEYLSLTDVNLVLAEENAGLRREIDRLKSNASDSLVLDSAIAVRHGYISAKVISNSVARFTNFITLDKGYEDGITVGMAVISSKGIVGKVRETSRHFSVVTSLLHVDVLVSGVIKRTGHFGTVHWNGRDPDHVELNYIPAHVKPEKGDTVVTSGFNAIYPAGIMIGTIEDVQLKKENQFHDLKVKLSQDFRKLSFVVAVTDRLHQEQDSVEQKYFEPIQ